MRSDSVLVCVGVLRLRGRMRVGLSCCVWQSHLCGCEFMCMHVLRGRTWVGLSCSGWVYEFNCSVQIDFFFFICKVNCWHSETRLKHGKGSKEHLFNCSGSWCSFERFLCFSLCRRAERENVDGLFDLCHAVLSRCACLRAWGRIWERVFLSLGGVDDREERGFWSVSWLVKITNCADVV